jgi:hypothetical protein
MVYTIVQFTQSLMLRTGWRGYAASWCTIVRVASVLQSRHDSVDRMWRQYHRGNNLGANERRAQGVTFRGLTK